MLRKQGLCAFSPSFILRLRNPLNKFRNNPTIFLNLYAFFFITKDEFSSHLPPWLEIIFGIFSSPRCSCFLFVFFSCCFEDVKLRIISGFPDLAPAQYLGSVSSLSICFGFRTCAASAAPAFVWSVASRRRFRQNFQAMLAAMSISTAGTETTIATIIVVLLVSAANKIHNEMSSAWRVTRELAIERMQKWRPN